MKTPHSLIPEQKENIKHGEVYFPIQKYITNLTKEAPVITMHWHEEAELTLITKGSCVYQIDLIEYEASTGDILFIPPLLLHSIILKSSQDFCSETYVFHMNLLGGYCRHLFYPLPYAYGKPRIIFTLSHYRGSSCI